ncbi:MAG: hypothetical protein KDA22_11410 [Phycisphaerales bacterium]|nr:hypothetical protein [Phycisphaerales bacterium]
MPVHDRSFHLRPVLLAALALAFVVLCARPASATQHIVNAGEEWQFLVDQVRPGDEIILAPGRHRPANLDGLRGEADLPITIRGMAATANRPAIIVADNWGLVLRNPNHVVLQDLLITGAKFAGIVLSADDKAAGTQDATPRPNNVTLRRVMVRRTSGEPDRDAVIAEGLDGLVLDTCRFDGWGGAAVRLLGCRNVFLRGCRFVPIDRLEHERAVSVEQGSVGVRLERCLFETGLRSGVAAGLDSARALMRRGAAPSAAPAASSEPAPDATPSVETSTAPDAKPAVREVTIEQCMFDGLETPIELGSVSNCTIRSCTMVRPRTCFVRFVPPGPDAGATKEILLGGNLFFWVPNDMPELVALQGESLGDEVSWEENLWWTAEYAVLKPERLPLPGRELLPQLLDVDPKLDRRNRPEATAAQGYGVQPLPRSQQP